MSNKLKLTKDQFVEKVKKDIGGGFNKDVAEFIFDLLCENFETNLEGAELETVLLISQEALNKVNTSFIVFNSQEDLEEDDGNVSKIKEFDDGRIFCTQS